MLMFTRLPRVAVAAGLALFAAGAWGPAMGYGAAPTGAGDTLAGRMAPEFTLPLLSGGTLSLRALRGRPVVLNFWGSWCVPCRAETPLLVRVHHAYASRGVVFVGMDVEDDAADARQFAALYHVDYPLVRTPAQVVRAYRLMGVPTTVFLGADGTVADRVTGALLGPDGERDLTARLDRLLGGASGPGITRPGVMERPGAHGGARGTAPAAEPPVWPWAALGGFVLAVLVLWGWTVSAVSRRHG